MNLLKETTERLDVLEEEKKKKKENNSHNPDLKAAQIQQTASAREYYRQAAVNLFTEVADAKFWQTVEKRGKWNNKK
jgi:hypothetical protein